jgi:hypothetical protein
MNKPSDHIVRVIIAIAPLVALCGCQSPTNSSSSLDADDIVTSSATPPTATAVTSSGRTYRVVRGNNQPDDILEYDWTTAFGVTLTLTSKATSNDADLTLPIKITSATVKVQQASGGIVTPPSGTDTEHYESVTTQASSNQFASVNSSVTMSFEVWYDLPNLRREALVTLSLGLADADGKTFTKIVEVPVAP